MASTYKVDNEFTALMEESTGTASNLRRYMQQISEGKEVPIKATDHSMSPFVNPGDTMFFGPSNLENTKSGDIVLYRLRDRAVVRRVVRRALLNGEAVFMTKVLIGKEMDPPVRVASIFGKLLFLERKGRRVKANALNRGFMDFITEWGTKSPLQKLGEAVMVFVPMSLRPVPVESARDAEIRRMREALH
ncbi:MAG: hypothetical protein FJX76_19330 [Armatimonadetes bacterium]|nr:hypothetical protein [Armatimonadota bacterium]